MMQSGRNTFASALAGLGFSAVLWAALAGAGPLLQGGDSFTEWALAVCPALVLAAVLLLSTSLLRSPVRILDVLGSLVTMSMAGGLSLLLLASFMAFDSGRGAAMQGSEIALAAAITVGFLLMAGRAMVGFGTAPPMGWYWPATGMLLGVLPLVLSSAVDMSAVLSCGTAMGYWLPRLERGSRAWALTGLLSCVGVLALGIWSMEQLAQSTDIYPPISSTVIVLVGPVVPVGLHAVFGRDDRNARHDPRDRCVAADASVWTEGPEAHGSREG